MDPVKYTVILPVIHWPTAQECLSTMKFPKENIFIIDNSDKNLGVSRSWNMGIDKMQSDNADWLIIVSTSIRFNKGGLDLIDSLKEFSDHNVLEANNVYGWHLIAFSKKLIDKVGKFDENFYPAYFEDLDYSIRIQKTFNLDNRKPLWHKINIDVTDTGMGFSVKNDLVYAPADPLIEYFKQKWGRHPGDYQEKEYDFPFNNENNSLDYWPRNNLIEMLKP